MKREVWEQIYRPRINSHFKWDIIIRMHKVSISNSGVVFKCLRSDFMRLCKTILFASIISLGLIRFENKCFHLLTCVNENESGISC